MLGPPICGFYCCVSNYLISDLREHFSAKIPDSASGQFTSGSSRSLKRQLVYWAHAPIQSSRPIDLTYITRKFFTASPVQFISYLKALFCEKFYDHFTVAERKVFRLLKAFRKSTGWLMTYVNRSRIRVSFRKNNVMKLMCLCYSRHGHSTKNTVKS